VTRPLLPAVVSRGLAPALAAALLLLAPAAGVAGKPAAKHKAAAARPAPAKRAPAPPPSTTKERAPSAGSSESKSASSDDGDDAGGESTPSAPAAGSGKKVTSKTYTFGAMDVEGKLKTPQLLYFLNRVKLELDMSAPDKRSFMKELQQSADDKSL